MIELGAKIIRQQLLVGDYMLASGGTVSIDTKKDLGELYSNIIQDHTRLSNEIKLAKECGIKLIFLVEHGEDIRCIDDVMQWKNPQLEKYRFRVKAVLSKIGLVKKFGKYSLDDLLTIAKINNAKIPKPPAPNEQLIKAMNTLTERYGCEFQFCTKDDCGKRIIEILGGDAVDRN